MRIDGNSKVYLGNNEIATIKKGNTVIWQKSAPAEIDYFYIENTYPYNSTLTLYTNSNGSPSSDLYSDTVQYSKDKENWTTITLTAGSQQTISMAKDDKVYFRNNNGKWNYVNSINPNKYWITSFLCGLSSYTVGGSTHTLLDYTNTYVTATQGCFSHLLTLYGGYNYGLQSASALKITGMSDYMCYGMFQGCNVLTTAPQTFTASTLSPYCFYQMFRDCPALTTAPQSLPATTLANYCYQNMFRNDTALTTAPVLPAKTLAQYSYAWMFYGCSSLNSVTVYADNISASNSHSGWLTNVAASGTFRNLGSATWPTSSASGIPTGWTEVTN